MEDQFENDAYMSMNCRLYLPDMDKDEMARQTVIGVRYDGSGKKIFYRHHGAAPVVAPQAPTLAEIGYDQMSQTLRMVRPVFELAGDKPNFSIKSNYHPRGSVQVQIWRRVRHRNHVWRWRNLIKNKAQKIHGNGCLVRVRYRHSGVCSPWSYFNVKNMGSGDFKVTYSRNVRT